MPGVRTASDALIRNTAKLPATELTPPERVIGRRTEDCIRSGVLLGAAEAVDGLVRRIKAEWPNGKAPHVIATGGPARPVPPLARGVRAGPPRSPPPRPRPAGAPRRPPRVPRAPAR